MERIEYLTQCWDLASTIFQGLAYLAEHPQNMTVREDVRNGVEALRDALEKEGFALEDGLWNALPEGGGAEAMSAALSRELSKALLKEVDKEAQLSSEAAQAVFQFYDAAPHTNPEVCQLLFNVCQKASRTAPEESFSYTLRLMEEHPELLSGESMPHPGYIYRPSEQMTFHRCPICGGEGTPYYRAFSYLIKDFCYPALPVKLWLKCGSCGNLYSRKYPKQWGMSLEEPVVIRPKAGVSPDAEVNSYTLHIWCNILRTLEKYTDGKDLLEVGIGGGELLAVALEMGYQADAVEIDRGGAQWVANLLGIPIWCGNFLDYAPERTWSIITMGDVIEHITDPGKALRNAHRLLKKDGVLWLSTPNFESAFSRMRKFEDPMWLEPFHVTYFSRTGLEALADSCGFTLLEYAVSPRYNGSMELIFRKKTEE